MNMELSRRLRRQALYRSLRRRLAAATGALVLAGILTVTWLHGNVVSSLAIAIIAVFGVLGANPWQIRRRLPGLDSDSLLVRAVAISLCLLAVLGIISLAGGRYL
jgi:hypothetical protein